MIRQYLVRFVLAGVLVGGLALLAIHKFIWLFTRREAK